MEDREYITLRRLEGSYWWLAGLRHLTFAMLKRHACPGAGLRLLDIGCGTGGMLGYLRERLQGPVLFGVDNHPLAIDFARERHAAMLCRGDAQALPFADGNFDAVLLLDVLYTRGLDDWRALREAHRVLSGGGVLIVNLPAFEILRGPHDAAVDTGHRYTAGELRGKLAAAGFEVVRVTYWNMFLAPLVLAKRRLLGRGAGEPQSDLVPLPGPVNALLGGVLSLERGLISRMNLPLGSSVFAVARKPGVPAKSG